MYLSIAPARNTVAAGPQLSPLLRITRRETAAARDSDEKI